MPRFEAPILVLMMAVIIVATPLGAIAAEGNPTGKEIFERCNYKYPGEDQKSTLTIVLRDKDGNEKKDVYHRFWKDYKGAGGIVDKMVLYTEFPPDAEGAAFMRWAYTASSDKNADQWIYLPVLKKIRRVAIRDPGDSFLGSDLTYADISSRDVDADDHKLVQILTRGNAKFFAVESTPVNKQKSLYSKTISWFEKDQDWNSCVKRQVDFYDKKGEALKQQVIKWQRVGKAWVWDEVLVKNVQTGHSSLFRISDVKINVGLKDEIFSERALSLGQ
jgi:Outer membrane lipoprotein-sorting protein